MKILLKRLKIHTYTHMRTGTHDTFQYILDTKVELSCTYAVERSVYGVYALPYSPLQFVTYYVKTKWLFCHCTQSL